jgi:transposase
MKWKRHAGEGLARIFSGKQAGQARDQKAEVKEFHAKIGELTIEKDFLSKAFDRKQ